MAENIQRSKGRSKAYRLDAGGAPAESGPFIGIVKNNIDPTRTGRIDVYIEYLSGPDEDNSDFWKPMSYISPFYGSTNPDSPETGTGGFTQNRHSYGMWFTPPDVGTKVICFFANGDPNQGYYVGSVVNPDAHHMVPAIGSTSTYVQESGPSSGFFANSTRLPTVEINDANPVTDDPRFFDFSKPIHSYQAGVLVQQGLISDNVRGTIGSHSYRESPSTVYGISTPGRPVYSGGYNDNNLESLLNADANNPGSVPVGSMKIIGRRGGHSFVMDDGDINGNDQLIRFRTAKGHQIILSDSGNTLYISHANGQTWIELGSQGTIDMFATNSVNIRSQGDINFHADKNINMNSKLATNVASDSIMNIESKQMQITADSSLLMYSEKFVGIKSDGSLSMQSAKAGSWDGGTGLTFKAGCIKLNSGGAPSVPKTTGIVRKKLPDVIFNQTNGWLAEAGKIDTVVSRAPTHEPYPLHDQGVAIVTDITNNIPTVPLNNTVATKVASIPDVEFDAIEAVDFEIQNKVDVSVGSIQPDQVTGMLAQASKNIPQNYNEISNELGVGKFGFSTDQLESAGYLKPGTKEFFITDAGTGNSDLNSVLGNPNVWTGKGDVENLPGLLADETLQDSVQADLYTKGLEDLKKNGVVTGQEAPEELAGLVSASSKFGAKNIKSWIEGKGDTTLETSINKEVKSAQYSVQLVDTKISDADKGFNTVETGSTTTTIRASVDTATTTIINNTKVQPPSYTRTAEETPVNPRRLALENQVNNITKVEIPAAKTKYLTANPDKKFKDFLQSAEYKALKEKRDSLNQQILNL